MKIESKVPLRSLNTFGISVDADYLVRVASCGEIREAWQFACRESLPVMVLGGGSNLLFTGDFRGLLMKVENDVIEKTGEDKDHVFVKAGAGTNWDRLVGFCVDHDWGGLENLSMIPGNVGASPIQNIGAYGVEMKDYFFELEFYSFSGDRIEHFQGEDCSFGYRDSIFKKKLRGMGVILSVTFRLDKEPRYHTEYGTVREELGRMGVQTLSLKHLREAVMRIRKNKLPDPAVIGNAGSFFKNPEVSSAILYRLRKEFPALVSYPLANGNFKLAAGWLIEQCGWKGYRAGDAGVHASQALVLVNHGQASGRDVLELSRMIRESVKERFGVILETEVNII